MDRKGDWTTKRSVSVFLDGVKPLILVRNVDEVINGCEGNNLVKFI